MTMQAQDGTSSRITHNRRDAPEALCERLMASTIANAARRLTDPTSTGLGFWGDVGAGLTPHDTGEVSDDVAFA